MSTPWFTASTGLVVAFCVVVLGTLGALYAGLTPAARRLGVPLWPALAVVLTFVALALGLAASGILYSPELPPRPLGLVALAIAGWLAAVRFTRFGAVVADTPLVFWVGLQFFRLPLELVMHQAAAEGVMPEVMTWTGRNFDVLTGIAAPVVAWGVHRGWPRGVVIAFNLIGGALLLNVVIVAILCMPTPIQIFFTEPANVWIAWPPFILLPSVLVVIAAVSHGVLTARLSRHTPASTGAE